MIPTLFENCKLAVQQLGAFKDLRTKFKPVIDVEAFGELRQAIEYILNIGEASIIPAELARYADLQVSEIIPRDILSHDDLKNLLFEIYAEDFKYIKKRETTRDRMKKLAKRNKVLAEFDTATENVFDSLSDLQDRFSTHGRIGDKTPFPELEKYIYGWERKRIYTIGAYSNVGKSKLAYQIFADAIRNGKKCQFFSLEVESAVVLANITCSYLRKPYLETLKEGNCHLVLPKHLISIVDDVYELDEMQDRIKLEKSDYVFIDFVQSLGMGTGKEYEVMSKNAVEIQKMAKKLNVTVFMVSQVNNDSRFKDGEEMSLRGSGALFQSSDCILMLNRDGDNIYMTLAKNKVGPSLRKFSMDYDFNVGKFLIDKEITLDFSLPLA